MTDKQRVLRLALARGDKGLTQVDFMLPNVVDDAKPITRLAARIKDLRDEGIEFVDGGRRNGMKVYILDRNSLAKASLPPGPQASPEAGGTQAPGAAPTPDPGVREFSSSCSPEAGGSEGSLFDMPTKAESLTFDDICPPRNAINDDLEAA